MLLNSTGAQRIRGTTASPLLHKYEEISTSILSFSLSTHQKITTQKPTTNQKTPKLNMVSITKTLATTLAAIASTSSTDALPAPSKRQVGFCTSWGLLPNQCTFVTLRRGGASDLYLFRSDCSLLGHAVNVNANPFNFWSQLRYTVVTSNLAGTPDFWYAGHHYTQPHCFSNFGNWECVFHFQC